MSTTSEEPWGLHSAVHELGTPPTPKAATAFSYEDTTEPPSPTMLAKDASAVVKSVTISVEEISTTCSAPSPPNPSHWSPPSDWGTSPASTRIERKDSKPKLERKPSNSSYVGPVVLCAPSPSTLSDSFTLMGPTSESLHFQRLIYRMENAGAKVMRDRLQEEWREPIDQTLRDELQLEKMLWTLTALQSPILDRYSPSDQCSEITVPYPPLPMNKRRKILELDGGIWEIYQASTIHPSSKITQIAASLSSLCTTVPLPPQAVRHMVPTLDSITSSGNLPLPLPHSSDSMHLVRCSRLPSLVPSSQLPILLKELYRVLKSEGVLEVRLVDALPDRATTGPGMAMWLDNHLTLNLEREFRCSRPMSLIPGWAKDAGFSMFSGGKIALNRLWKVPAASFAAGQAQEDEHDVIDQVASAVLRNIWKDTWGPYVQSGEEGPKPFQWWWEDEELVKECIELDTTWNIGSLVVVKEDPF